jgi:hypothetical protein
MNFSPLRPGARVGAAAAQESWREPGCLRFDGAHGLFFHSADSWKRTGWSWSSVRTSWLSSMGKRSALLLQTLYINERRRQIAGLSHDAHPAFFAVGLTASTATALPMSWLADSSSCSSNDQGAPNW